jgi:hypothetical protein
VSKGLPRNYSTVLLRELLNEAECGLTSKPIKIETIHPDPPAKPIKQIKYKYWSSVRDPNGRLLNDG